MMFAATARHHPALPFYQSFGFIEAIILPDTGGGDLELRMVKDLTWHMMASPDAPNVTHEHQKEHQNVFIPPHRGSIRCYRLPHLNA
jgi:hypothetical protein